MTALDAWNDPSAGPTRIKICGVTKPEHIEAAIAGGANAVGLVRVPKSPRFVDHATADQLAAVAADRIAVVTLLADPAMDADHWGTWTQLHGDEQPDTVHLFQQRRPTIKAIPWSTPEAILTWDAFGVERLLVDGPRGGSGMSFDHDALARVRAQLHTPLVIAGGLDADCVTQVIEHIAPWGVDVSSGVESTRGVKDPARILEFCHAVRQLDGSD